MMRCQSDILVDRLWKWCIVTDQTNLRQPTLHIRLHIAPIQRAELVKYLGIWLMDQCSQQSCLQGMEVRVEQSKHESSYLHAMNMKTLVP